VQLGSNVMKLLTNMAGIKGKPAWMRQARTGMGSLYCIRLCNQVEVRNVYAFAIVAPAVDMITVRIVVRMIMTEVLQTVKSCDTIDRFRASGIDWDRSGPAPSC
jgi:hypothetical protein